MKIADTKMQTFIHDDFLLHSEEAKVLYHEYASKLPIIDFHSHLPAKDISEDRVFGNLTELWLNGDHYKWRAMRANGVGEIYCTGNASSKEKFKKWAATVPATIRNPLFHWTHLELKRYFNIDTLLTAENADRIYDQCNEMIQSQDFSVKNLLKRMKVEVVCTTDDPADVLQYHRDLNDKNEYTKVYPTFRPDRAMIWNEQEDFRTWIHDLSKICGREISSFETLIDALKLRINFFSELGGRISDHGLDQMYSEAFSEKEIEELFYSFLNGKIVSESEIRKYRSALLYHLSVEYARNNWVQQFHIGAIRNNRSKYYKSYGSDLGFDSIDDREQAASMSNFLDRLDSEDQLAKTILYNLNPAQNEVFASMLSNFNDDNIKGKMQFGTAWWFLDQKDGIEKQLNTFSNFGLLSNFIGMVTDSRSFLSYPRHEYFRRILCNLLGEDMKRGEVPHDYQFLGKIVQDICYYNAKQYFNF